MATRTLSTKLAIQGESEYRASISRINAELKAMQSALKLTESQYQTNANSMDAIRAKGEALKGVYDTQKKKVDELRSALANSKQAQQQWADKIVSTKQKISENEAALEKLKKATGDTTAEQKRLTEEGAKLRQQLGYEEAGFAAAEKGANSWQTQLNNAEIQLNNLSAEIQKNDSYMAEAEKAADGCATSIDEFGREVDDTAESVKGLGTILASQELAEFSAEMKEVLAECLTAYSEYEAGMAAVRRTTGLTGEDIESLGEYFRTLSTEIPITTQELTAIATTAGQLGITGKENVQAFTETMAKLATTTDLTAETAATMLAQLSNITGVRDYERLGSVVAALGDATATTATKVVEMSQGIAATGNLAGMSATDVLAISAAVGSLGIESQAGSTAMSTLIATLYKATQTGDKLADFASVAGMSASEFKRSWGEDAVGTLERFISGLNDTERNGKSAIVLLDELGITNVRQVKAILGLASAEGLLSGTIAQANTAWTENAALSEKAGIMFDTMQAKMTTLDNAANNLKVAVGEALAPALITLAEGGQSAIEWITAFVEKHPTLTGALTLTASGIAGITTAIAGAKAAYKALDFLGMTKPLDAIAAAAAGAGGGISGLAAALGTIALPAAAAAAALAGVVAVANEIKTVKTVGFLGEGHTLEEYAANVKLYEDRISELREEQDSLANCGADLTMVQNNLSTATIGLAHAQKELAAAQEAEAQAAELAAEAETGLVEAGSSVVMSAEDITDAVTGIAEAYRGSYEDCRKSLEGQIGLFDKFMWKVDESADSAAEMLEIWSAQAQSIENYGENLKKAAEYGLDQRLLENLADGSTDSAGYLAVIITEIEKAQRGTGTMAASAEEAVAKFNEAFAKTEEAKESAAATMAMINSNVAEQLGVLEQMAAEVDFDGFWDAVDNAFGNVGSEFEGIGSDAIGGMIVGINRESGPLYSAVFAVVANAMEAARAGADTHSPSRKTDKIFQDVGEGMIVGIRKKEAAVREATHNVAAQAVRFDSGEVARLAETVAAATPDFSSLFAAPRRAETNSATRSVHMETHITINAREGQSAREIAREVGYALEELLNEKEA